MSYWLLKTEPTSYSIDDLERDRRTAWTGIRNFQARNHMRDGMKKGDLVLIYHSSSDPTGIYGIGRIVREAYADPTALDPKDEHYEPKSPWVAVDVEFVKKFKRPVTLAEIKADKVLRHMLVAKKGMRLSVMPVEKIEFEKLSKMF